MKSQIDKEALSIIFKFIINKKLNDHKKAVIIVNEVLAYIHTKFIREGSVFSGEFVDFRQEHNDRITEIVEKRLNESIK